MLGLVGVTLYNKMDKGRSTRPSIYFDIIFIYMTPIHDSGFHFFNTIDDVTFLELDGRGEHSLYIIFPFKSITDGRSQG